MNDNDEILIDDDDDETLWETIGNDPLEDIETAIKMIKNKPLNYLKCFRPIYKACLICPYFQNCHEQKQKNVTDVID